MKILPIVLMLGLGCSYVMMDQTEKKKVCDRVAVYAGGVPHEISNADLREKIILEAVRLFKEADDFYYKAVSESDIQGFRQAGCVEVIFAKPREIVIQAVNEKKIVAKLLVPVADAMCNPDAHVIYGNPDYGSFNLLLNSKGCSGLRKLFQEVSLFK